MNELGTFTFACKNGWQGDGQKGKSQDINECTDGTNTCDAHAVCTNLPGSFNCTCNVGWTGDGQKGDCGPPGYTKQSDGNYYKFVRSLRLSWAAARSARQPGDLAIIHNQATLDVVGRVLGAAHGCCPGGNLEIGGWFTHLHEVLGTWGAGWGE